MTTLDLRNIPLFYINMPEATQRRDSVEKATAQVGFKSVTRVEGVKVVDTLNSASDPIAGCAAAHFSVMDKQKPPFIVLEDDCVIKNFVHSIKIPVDADALYLGVSCWGRLDSETAVSVIYDRIDDQIVRVYNMLSAHAILFLNDTYAKTCARIAEYSMNTSQHVDIGYAEIHKFFNVYAVDDPLFYQTSSEGSTNRKLTCKDYKARQRLNRAITKDATT